MPQEAWHTMSAQDVCRALGTDAQRGLSASAVRRREREYGPNQIASRSRSSLWSQVRKQFQDALVLVLLGAAAISFTLGEWLDALAIAVIVVLNAVMGIIQEYRAERSLQMLQQLAAPKALVLRDGQLQQVASDRLVPGDVVFLESGARVPADCRLVESTGLETDESPLTGESAPVAKDEAWIGKPHVGVGDRRNMVYLGSTIARGWAKAVVVATGMATEVGRIAHMLHEAEEGETPLQRRLAQLGRYLVAGCLAIVAVVFVTGLWSGIPLYGMFLTAVSLAVAAVPEGLPAAVTVCLALGVQRMARRRAIVRRLPAVETLGCATVICSDKTGTLTSNAMRVASVWLPGRQDPVQVSSGKTPQEGRFVFRGQPIDPRSDAQLMAALAAGALCNHAQLTEEKGRGLFSGDSRSWRAFGDPTEVALLIAARQAGLVKDELAARHPALLERPFDSDRRMMSILCRGDWQGGDGRLDSVVTKGAVEAVVARCDRIAGPGGPAPLTDQDRRAIMRRADQMAAQGLRVLAVAWRTVPSAAGGSRSKTFDPAWETGLIFGGLLALYDPPRPEVAEALQAARRAGVRTIMLTGDHGATAAFIARAIGLAKDGEPVITGEELDRMSDDELRKALATSRVFARVTPAHKLRIVRALKERGEIIAMTGDGVNDAPALKEAHIGIAMGRTGSDVAREAAAMVLADDNFATIVAAIEEGRGIYDNIRKFVRYLLTCNAGEILAMFLAMLAGLPLPLLPLQILWMNLVTDGLPALGLGLERTEPGVMARPPRRPDESFFAGGLHWRILYRGILIGLTGLAALAVGLFVLRAPLAEARTLAFTTLVFAQLLFAFQCRSESTPVWRLGLLSNPALLGGVCLSAVMQLAVVHWPPLQRLFGTVPLPAYGWLLAGGLVLAGAALDLSLRSARRQIARVPAVG